MPLKFHEERIVCKLAYKKKYYTFHDTFLKLDPAWNLDDRMLFYDCIVLDDI